MKNVRALVSFTTLLAAVLLLVLPMPAFAQNNAFDAQFGATPWAQNNVRTASAYNWKIDNSAGGAQNFTFPQGVCTNALSFSGGVTKNPFASPLSTGVTVTITDAVAANTETVALTSATFSGSLCTLSIANLNAHSSYILSSGTCGLQEAYNDAVASGGGIIEYTQESVAMGCASAATITGLTKNFRANVYIHDISNGQNTWYTLQPSTLSALATPATRSAAAGNTQVIDGTAVGTFANAAGFFCVSYMDVLGGLSPCSASFTYTPAGSLATNWAAPAASTGAVGWISCAGITSTSVQYCLTPTASNCVLSTITPIPSCAMGANAVYLGPVTTTFLAPGQVTAVYRVNTQSHTTFAYAPNASFSGLWQGFQQHFGPFVATAGGTTTQVQVLGTVPLPSAVLNTIGKTIRVHGHITMTAGTSETPVLNIQLGPTWTTGTPTNICIFKNTTALSAAVYSLNFSCTMTTNATGTSGTVMPDGMAVVALGAGTTAGTAMPELGTAAITDNISIVNWLYVTYVPTSGTDTAVQLLDLHIESLN